MFALKDTYLLAFFALAYLVSANVIVPNNRLDEIEPQSSIRERRETEKDGISATVDVQSNNDIVAKIRGQERLLDDNSHQVNTWGESERTFNSNSEGPIGPLKSSAGADYWNKRYDGRVSVSGSHTPGSPNTGSVDASLPLLNEGNTRLDLTGKANFEQGIKPNSHLGLTFNQGTPNRGISASVDVQPHIGALAKLRGQMGLYDDGTHQISSSYQYERNLDTGFRPIGPPKNSVEFNYANKDIGASAFATGTSVSGLPNTATVGGKYNLFTDRNSLLDLVGQSQYGGGKPNHYYGLNYRYTFGPQ